MIAVLLVVSGCGWSPVPAGPEPASLVREVAEPDLPVTRGARRPRIVLLGPGTVAAMDATDPPTITVRVGAELRRWVWTETGWTREASGPDSPPEVPPRCPGDVSRGLRTVAVAGGSVDIDGCDGLALIRRGEGWSVSLRPDGEGPAWLLGGGDVVDLLRWSDHGVWSRWEVAQLVPVATHALPLPGGGQVTVGAPATVRSDVEPVARLDLRLPDGVLVRAAASSGERLWLVGEIDLDGDVQVAVVEVSLPR